MAWGKVQVLRERDKRQRQGENMQGALGNVESARGKGKAASSSSSPHGVMKQFRSAAPCRRPVEGVIYASIREGGRR